MEHGYLTQKSSIWTCFGAFKRCYLDTMEAAYCRFVQLLALERSIARIGKVTLLVET